MDHGDQRGTDDICHLDVLGKEVECHRDQRRHRHQYHLVFRHPQEYLQDLVDHLDRSCPSHILNKIPAHKVHSPDPSCILDVAIHLESQPNMG